VELLEVLMTCPSSGSAPCAGSLPQPPARCRRDLRRWLSGRLPDLPQRETTLLAIAV